LETKESLFSAGTELFAERGLEGATVEEIARRARVNKAMISYHYRGKEGLYRAIVADMFGHAESLLRGLRQSPLPADERLRRFLSAFAEIVTQRPSLPAMILREVLSGGAALQQFLPYFIEVYATVRDIVEQGMQERTFRRVDPLLTHLGLVGGLVFFFATSRFRSRLIGEGGLPVEIPSPEVFVAHLQEFAARGLAPGPSEPGRGEPAPAEGAQ
jgi:TetR/AcrR family transcriptional regulator